MSRKIYIGVDDAARRVKRLYVGVDGIARRIRKAYIGIGGVARPCFTGGELAYFGTVEDLSLARSALAATTVGKYALFGGGAYVSNAYNTVDAYDKSLVRSQQYEGLTYETKQLAATTVGKYALFGGGYLKSNYPSNAIDAFDDSLVKTQAENLINTAGGNTIGNAAVATTVGKRALFLHSDYESQKYIVHLAAYEADSLTRIDGTVGEEGAHNTDNGAATTTGRYALFAGGYYDISTVMAFDEALTRTNAPNLSVGRSGLAAASVGKYAIFGGGSASASWTDAADAYDDSLTKVDVPALYQATSIAATTLWDFAIFAGGNGGGGTTFGIGDTSAVRVYDDSLVQTSPGSLKNARGNFAATAVGEYALFAGGISTNNAGTWYYGTVDVFTV